MNYYVVAIRKIRSDLVDIITELAFSHGCSGIEEPLEFVQHYENYEPKVILSEVTQILIYFESPPPKEFLDILERKFSLTTNVLTEPNRDWLHEWKKGFHSFELVSGYWVVPSWESTELNEDKIIRIDPGMAFGTGTHETTQVIAELLLERSKKNAASTILDVGCGTGILSILCSRLGASEITATEIDQTALEVARENYVTNRVDVNLVDVDLSHQVSGFQWVIANIIDGVLSELKPHLTRLCLEEMFLSGIVAERQHIFEKNFLSEIPFKVERLTRRGEWLGYHLVRG